MRSCSAYHARLRYPCSASGVNARYHRQVLPSPTSRTVWWRNSRCADADFDEIGPGLSHMKRQELPLLQATFECSESGHVDKKGVHHLPSRTRKHCADVVAGCTSASFRAVPLHSIVTLSNRSYHRTNLYACRQIASWVKAQSSPKQCSFF